MKGTFIIHLRADEKCIWVQWKGKEKSLRGQRQTGCPTDERVRNERFNLTDMCENEKNNASRKQ